MKKKFLLFVIILSFTFSIARPAQASSEKSPDQYEPDNSYEFAASITAGETQTRNLSSNEDQDWVTFTLEEDSSVEIRTSHETQLTNTRLWLLNQDRTEIPFTEYDDSDSEGFSLIEFSCDETPLSAGTYFILIEGNNQTEFSEYDLFLLASPCEVIPAETVQPTVETEVEPTETPEPLPTEEVLPTPTEEPELQPTPQPTAQPTEIPTEEPQDPPDGIEIINPMIWGLTAGTYDDTHPSVTYGADPWLEQSDSQAYLESYHYSTDIGSDLEVRFIGTQFTFLYTSAADSGSALIYIDEVLVDTLDQASGGGTLYQQSWQSEEYSYGGHTIKIENELGGTVSFDGFTISNNTTTQTFYDDTSASITYYNNTGVLTDWSERSLDEYFGGTSKYISNTGYHARLTFTGVQISLLYEANPSGGIMEIYIDDVLQTKLNQYNEDSLSQTRWDSNVLSDGEHTIKLSVYEEVEVNIDALIVSTIPINILSSGTYNDNNTAIRYSWISTSDWVTQEVTGAVQNSWKASTNTSDVVEASFHGRQISLVFGRNNGFGEFSVYIDNVLYDAVDQSAGHLELQQTWDSPELALENHVLKLVHTGGGNVNVDALIVRENAESGTPTVLTAGTYDDGDTGVDYAGVWSTVVQGTATNGLVHRSDVTGSVTEVVFSGRQISFIYTKNLSLGSLAVYLDDIQVATIDQSNVNFFDQKVWNSPELSAGQHTLRLVHLGGGTIYVDGFIVRDSALEYEVLSEGTYDDGYSGIYYTGSWIQYNVSGVSEGHWHVSTAVGAKAEAVFSGQQISIIFPKNGDLGTFSVYIDDVLVDTVDEYAASIQYPRTWESDTLSSGEHTLRLVHATGTYIILDSLMILTGPPAAPTLISPNGTIATNNPLFVWYATANATGYWLTVGRTSDGAYLFNSYVQPNTNGYTCWLNLPVTFADGGYWFKVTAGNASGWGSASSQMNFTVSLSAPAAPTLIAPNGTVTTNNPLFVWYATANATGYWLTVGRSSDGAYMFNSYVQPNTNGYTCWLNLPVTFADGGYWFKVTAGNAFGWGSASAQMNFTVSVSAPAAPTLIAPNGTVGTNSPLFVWYATANASGYWLTVGRSSDGAYLFNSYVQPNTNGYTCWLNLPVTFADGNYWFKVTAGNASGWGDASEQMEFVIEQ